MIPFNFKGLLRFTGRLLSQVGVPGAGWTPRRVGILTAFHLGFPLFEVGTWLALLLDELLFPRYRQVAVEEPVFIVGFYRSGTTFLHRLLAQDTQRFTTMHLWEMFLAPSVVQRRVARALLRLDRRLGAPLVNLVDRLERRWQEKNVMQEIAMRAPEEDEYLLLHIWSTQTGWFWSGLLEGADRYVHFDLALPEAERRRIMAFYKRCLQRHLYAHDEGRPHYLAKNPALTPKLDTVYAAFPDAKIIWLVRSPLEAIPSYISFMRHMYRALGHPAADEALRDYIVAMARHWYHYALERLDGAAGDSYVVVRYDRLIDDPAGTVAEIYRHFGFEIGPAYAEVLQREAERARQFHSQHDYSLDQVGLTREEIVAAFGEVWDRFGFDRG